MVQADGAVISQRVLDQGVSIFAMSLGQTLVLLGQIHTVTLNPGGDPGLVVGRGRAVREVDLIGQLVVLALDTQHAEQIDIGRCCSYETVNDRVTRQHVVHQQGVHG